MSYRIPYLILFLLLVLATAFPMQSQTSFNEEFEEFPELEFLPEDQFERAIITHEMQENGLPDSLLHKENIFARLHNSYELLDSSTNWFKLLLRGRIELENPRVHYPKFPEFCFKVYYWGDKFFNGTDPEYVRGTGRRWKARIVNDNWMDSYLLSFNKMITMRLASDINQNLGAYVQFMSVSVGLSHSISEIMGRKEEDHRRLSFGFSCQRFDAQLTYTKNNQGSYFRSFGDYNNHHLIKIKFPGLELERIAFDFLYFFNNHKYSNGAAYSYSKYQLRSQGSPIAGFSFNHLNLGLDLSLTPAQLLPYLPISAQPYRFHYNSYTLSGGYGFNWVWSPKLLFNITAVSGFGIAKTYEDSFMKHSSFFAFTPLAKMSLTYNLRDFFLNLAGVYNGTLYNSDKHVLLQSLETLTLNAGFRF